MPTLEQETNVENIFDDEVIATQVEAFYDENGEDGEAYVRTIAGNKLVLTMLEFERLEQERTVSVYIFPNQPEVYQEMDKEYRKILLDNSSGSDFWDMWTAMKNVLDMSYLVTQEVFQV